METFIIWYGSFNPLHCGAVVASRTGTAGSAGAYQVSIPFIAGQWSLRCAAPRRAAGDGGFQSPSLRGSGLFEKMDAFIAAAALLVSIPFIAGQWSLPIDLFAAEGSVVLKFQSPSLRGSGLFRGADARRRA